MKQAPIKFICNATTYFDKTNGNTYHSCQITKCSNKKTIYAPFQYGYEDHYRQSAKEAMLKAGWIPKKYEGQIHMYERENGYPIFWSCTEGPKRDCIANGKP